MYWMFYFILLIHSQLDKQMTTDRRIRRVWDGFQKPYQIGDLIIIYAISFMPGTEPGKIEGFVSPLHQKTSIC